MNFYDLTITKRTARPRSERLRKLGAAASGGSWVIGGARVDPSNASKVEYSYNKLQQYAPSAIVVMSESDLDAALAAGMLESDVLYLGLEE